MSAREGLDDALRGAGKYVDGKKARCPAHDDNNASLSIGDRRDGKGIVLKCHAGCDYRDVLTALGMSPRDLFDDDGMREVYSPKRDYRYPDGRVVHRKPDKSFPQSGNTKGNQLFHADRIGSAETVYWPEGEKDVEAIEAAGGVAVCSAMGAGKAKLADLSPLRGKHVIVVADKDAPGRQHAREVAELLDGIAASVRIVEAAAGKDTADHIAAGETLDALQPVGDSVPINGAELLDDIEAFARRFLAFPTAHCLVVLVLWAVHTWAVGAFYVTPRLVLDSPEPGSGKTRVLEVLALLCHAAKLTLSTTTAALYRRIAAAGDKPPTVLQDEADRVFSSKTPQSEDLVALYNSGYKRGATVDRCEGDTKNMRVVEFPVFAPVALAGLAGKMPATILDRAVSMHMRRRAPDEQIDEFRERDARIDAAPLRDRIEAWALANFQELSAARPKMPEGVRDRPAEVWEALLATADIAGGQWPARAREACRHFVLDGDPQDKISMGLRLLRDLQTVFADEDRMFSSDIVSALTSDSEAEWCDLWGKPLDQRRLAKELKRYGVESQEVRIGAVNRKGYVVAGDTGLAQAWHRYLTPIRKRDKRDKRDIAGEPVADMSRLNGDRDKRDTRATTKTAHDQQLFSPVADVAAVADTNGSAQNAATHPERCACGRPAPVISETGLCQWCSIKASKAAEAVR